MARFIFACWITWSAALGAQAPGRQDAALTSLVKQFVAAQTAFDAKALDRLLSRDYLEVSPLGEVDPRDKVLGFYDPSQKPPASVMATTASVDEVSVREHGTTAVVVARFNYAMTSKGEAMPPRSIRATLVCVRDGGAWQVASAQYTSIRPTGK